MFFGLFVGPWHLTTFDVLDWREPFNYHFSFLVCSPVVTARFAGNYTTLQLMGTIRAGFPPLCRRRRRPNLYDNHHQYVSPGSFPSIISVGSKHLIMFNSLDSYINVHLLHHKQLLLIYCKLSMFSDVFVKIFGSRFCLNIDMTTFISLWMVKYGKQIESNWSVISNSFDG